MGIKKEVHGSVTYYDVVTDLVSITVASGTFSDTNLTVDGIEISDLIAVASGEKAYIRGECYGTGGYANIGNTNGTTCAFITAHVGYSTVHTPSGGIAPQSNKSGFPNNTDTIRFKVVANTGNFDIVAYTDSSSLANGDNVRVSARLNIRVQPFVNTET